MHVIFKDAMRVGKVVDHVVHNAVGLEIHFYLSSYSCNICITQTFIQAFASGDQNSRKQGTSARIPKAVLINSGLT